MPYLIHRDEIQTYDSVLCRLTGFGNWLKELGDTSNVSDDLSKKIEDTSESQGRNV